MPVVEELRHPEISSRSSQGSHAESPLRRPLGTRYGVLHETTTKQVTIYIKQRPNKLLYQLLEHCDKPEDILGVNGLLASLQESILERGLAAHLGYDKHEAAGRVSRNSRNGHCVKCVVTGQSGLQVTVPRSTASAPIPFGQNADTVELESRCFSIRMPIPLVQNPQSTRGIGS